MLILTNEIKQALTFYKMPRILFENEQYGALSLRAKTMYMLLFDRLDLSLKNDWTDEEGYTYQYYTIEQFMIDLDCSNRTVINTKKELVDSGLLREVSQGANKPNRIYLGAPISHNGREEITRQGVKKLHNGREEITRQGVKKLHGIKTEGTRLISQTDVAVVETATEDGKSEFNIFQYYQKRIGGIDSFQVESLEKYITEDGLETELVKRAIDKGADKGVRNFSYINTILNNWTKNGIKTIAQQDEEERKFHDRKANSQGEQTDNDGYDHFAHVDF